MFTVYGIMYPRCCRPVARMRCIQATGRQHCMCVIPQDVNTDGRNHRPKHVQLIGIINKPLLLHLVGCLYYSSSSIWYIFQHYFRHPVVYILVKYRSQFDLYLLSFLSTGCNFNPFKIYSFLL